MTIETTAIVRNGKLELTNGAAAKLTEGMEVRVSITPMPAKTTEAAPQQPPADDPLEPLIGSFEGPEDLAENHDHYLYGTPRRKSQ